MNLNEFVYQDLYLVGYFFLMVVIFFSLSILRSLSSYFAYFSILQLVFRFLCIWSISVYYIYYYDSFFSSGHAFLSYCFLFTFNSGLFYLMKIHLAVLTCLLVLIYCDLVFALISFFLQLTVPLFFRRFDSVNSFRLSDFILYIYFFLCCI